MLNSPRMLEEHLEKTAQTLKEMYYPRRPDLKGKIDATGEIAPPPIYDGSGALKSNPWIMKRPAERYTIPHLGFNYVLPAPGPAKTDKNYPAIHCFQCGCRFPVTDFLYTKKSGLCISCWEVKNRLR